jgi:hypothetical protein
MTGSAFSRSSLERVNPTSLTSRWTVTPKACDQHGLSKRPMSQTGPLRLWPLVEARASLSTFLSSEPTDGFAAVTFNASACVMISRCLNGMAAHKRVLRAAQCRKSRGNRLDLTLPRSAINSGASYLPRLKILAPHIQFTQRCAESQLCSSAPGLFCGAGI